jgi:hypothetical protein
MMGKANNGGRKNAARRAARLMHTAAICFNSITE